MQGTSCTQEYSIIQEAQSGNSAAFEQLVHAHDQSVLRLALRITGSPIDAQDIYQETFLRAFKKLAGFRHECMLSTWIYRIATNVCLDHLRKKNKRRETSAPEMNADGEEYDLLNRLPDDRALSNPERTVLRREIGAHISRALTRLTPRERIIFELQHYQGLKLRTLSRILNCSETTIKTTLFRARQKLRVYLAGSYLSKNCSAKRALMGAV